MFMLMAAMEEMEETANMAQEATEEKAATVLPVKEEMGVTANMVKAGTVAMEEMALPEAAMEVPVVRGLEEMEKMEITGKRNN